jgi:adenosylcobinamide kinase/adenosylcobinamide-phosphate guanylyltransferase
MPPSSKIRRHTPSAVASGKNPVKAVRHENRKPKSGAKLIVVLGGARSGKSRFALDMGRGRTPRAFVATAEPFDREMTERIMKHQQARGKGWKTIEVPTNIAGWLTETGSRYPSIVVDCITLWLNNLLRAQVRPAQVLTHVRKFLQAIRACPGQVIVVSNELGLGVVPGETGSRQFRDLSGRMNQLMAAEADEVYFLVSGLPLRLK